MDVEQMLYKTGDWEASPVWIVWTSWLPRDGDGVINWTRPLDLRRGFDLMALFRRRLV